MSINQVYDNLTIQHNTDLKRFETFVQVDNINHLSFISYRVNGNTLIYDHTIVAKALEGCGIGSALVKHALNHAHEMKKNVIPECSFVAHYIDKHSEFQPLLVH